MDADQVLRVGIGPLNLGLGWEFFYAKMNKAGFVSVPPLIIMVLQKRMKA